ncbi:MAG: type II toxin-antitoxin system RelE/ParE family toxin [Ignavibacteria bacterium]|nr:type II toxin-antitoxin system RelE/ParE family toxin [Ignavibacteria bacterium]
MPRVLLLAPEAEEDLSAAHAWYEMQRPGLGSEFLAEVAHVFGVIELFPEQHRVVRGATRRALLHRFPYCVYYIFGNDLISVTAVMHARRDPRRWEERGAVEL